MQFLLWGYHYIEGDNTITSTDEGYLVQKWNICMTMDLKL